MIIVISIITSINIIIIISIITINTIIITSTMRDGEMYDDWQFFDGVDEAEPLSKDLLTPPGRIIFVNPENKPSHQELEERVLQL